VIVGLKDSSGVIDAFRNTLLHLRDTGFRAFTGSELIVDLSMSSALGGFETGLKLKGVISSTRVAAPLQSFTPAEEERAAEVLHRHESYR
jgi:dihydrodipicolinate synthase/N-acetylneuraminate lyase